MHAGSYAALWRDSSVTQNRIAYLNTHNNIAQVCMSTA